MKTCQKENCNKNTVLRSKFCEDHKKRYTKRDIEQERERQRDTERKLKRHQEIEEDRRLSQEQQEEYNMCLEHDRKMFEEREMQKILSESLDEYYNEKKILIQNMENNEYYTVKIKFPKDNIIIKFDINSKLSDIFDIIDIYIYENKLNIKNYNIVSNFPKKVFTKDDMFLELCELNLGQNFLIHIQDLDS